jgi:hypothetical protein
MRDVELYALLGKLAVRLERASEKISEAQSARVQLDCVTDAVDAISECLSGIPTFKQETLIPLTILAVALGEVQLGGKPELFEVKGRIGRQPTAYEDFLRAQTVWCILVLHSAGVRKSQARKEVAKLWRKLGVRQVVGENVRDVKETTIEGWEAWVQAQPVGSAEHKLLRSASASSPSRDQARAVVLEAGQELASLATWKDKVPS